MKLTFKILWYDLWVGLYWAPDSWRLFFCPLPCVVIVIDLFQWGRSMINKGVFKNGLELNTTVRNIFSVITFIYYMILLSVIVWWVR
jgi:hypothetical protein